MKSPTVGAQYIVPLPDAPQPDTPQQIIPKRVAVTNVNPADTDADRSAMKSPTVGATHWVAPTNVSKESKGDAEGRPNGPQRGSIGAIIGAYKMSVTRKIVQQYGGMPHVWQRNYYEHIIRNEAEHNRIRLFMESNPVNWLKDEENPERQR
jgi:hypothetical protein